MFNVTDPSRRLDRKQFVEINLVHYVKTYTQFIASFGRY